MPNATRDPLIHAAIAAGEVVTDPETGYVRIGSNECRAVSRSGYLVVTYRRSQFLAHRVMWLAHHPETPSFLQVNHRNQRRWDNRLSNLEAVTQRGNIQHAHRIAYAAIGSAQDDNVLDPAWLRRVMTLAADPDATTAQISALKTLVAINDSAPQPFAVRSTNRPIHRG